MTDLVMVCYLMSYFYIFWPGSSKLYTCEKQRKKDDKETEGSMTLQLISLTGYSTLTLTLLL
jgi:hypothetical protein